MKNMEFPFLKFCLLYIFFDFFRINIQNPFVGAVFHSPEVYSLDKLLNFSDHQASFVLGTWKLEKAWINPSMIRHPKDYNKTIIIWRMPDKGKHDKIGYMWLNSNTLEIDSMPDMIELFGRDNSRSNLVAEDARIFVHNGEFYIVYNTHLTHFKRLYFSRLYFDPELSALYVKHPVTHINIDHEMKERHQKNWTPFDYCPLKRKGCTVLPLSTPPHPSTASSSSSSSSSSSPFPSSFQWGSYVPSLSNSSSLSRSSSSSLSLPPPVTPHLLFSYSINPHRIVALHPTPSPSPSPSTPSSPSSPSSSPSSSMYEGVEEVQASTVSLTRLVKEDEWEWGEMRGGSPALRISDTHYLSFFHSSGRFTWKYCISYFMGAYLFSSSPPFQITHLSPAPLLSRPLINESNGGWAYRFVDYVVFPMGFILNESTITLSLGRNDKDSWLIQFEREGLLNYLRPVRSEVLGDSQWREASEEEKEDGGAVIGTFKLSELGLLEEKEKQIQESLP